MSTPKGTSGSNVVVLRWGHRPRDLRVTTHVALTARALGASGFILADVEDKSIKAKIDEVAAEWGGRFSFEMGVPWRKAVGRWKESGGIVVHLTMYGQNISETDVMHKIRSSHRSVMVIVGSQKVPSEFFSEEFSDYNIAIGGQPHSEVAALAVFLDRLFEGSQLSRKFEDARIGVLHSPRGKRLVRVDSAPSTSNEIV